jgi:hypothetical protein
MSGQHREQFARVERYLARFKEFVQGHPHTRSSEHYQDDVYAFFQNCYHLKDWIKHDPACAGWQPHVEDVIDESADLSLCADLCNGLKHLSLTRGQRSGQSPEFAQVAVHVIVADAFTERESVHLQSTYTIRTATGLLDGYELAQRCVAAWRRYIAINA